MTWHVYVYHRVTGNSIYNLKKANRKMGEELGNKKYNKLLSIAAREERKRGRGEETKWEGWEAGGRDKRWEEHKTERRME